MMSGPSKPNPLCLILSSFHVKKVGGGEGEREKEKESFLENSLTFYLT